MNLPSTKFGLIGLSLCLSIALSAQKDSSKTKSDSLKKASKELPLEPTRQIELKNPKITWTSVDVDPSNQKIAFDAMGDLYQMPINGGKAEALTQGMAYEVHPRYSPDGKSMLYISDKSGAQNLWVMDLESKKERQITKDVNQNYFSADWSPDGQYIVAAKGRRNIKLHLYHVEKGSGVQLITQPATLKSIDPFFSKDGKYIYFSARKGAWQYNADLPQYSIMRYNMEEGELESVVSNYGSAFTPTLSNADKLVYGTRFETETALRVRDLKTGDEEWLKFPVQRDEQESIATLGVLPAMDFDDAGNLYYGAHGKIWKLNLSTKEASALAMEIDIKLDLGPRLDFKYPISDEEEQPINQIRDAVPSPNGEWLAFTALNRLYLYNFKSKESKRITSNNFTEALPTWSTDGKRLAFCTWEGKEGAVYEHRLGKKGAKKLDLSPGLYADVNYSPDGKRLIMIRQSARSYRDAYSPFVSGSDAAIVYYDFSSKKMVEVAPAKGRGNPHFSNDGSRIYLNSSKGLISIRWDGSDEKEHLKLTGITTFGSSLEEFHNHGADHDHEHSLLPNAVDAWREKTKPSTPSELRISPDGNSVLAQINNDLFVVHLPRYGKAAKISVANPDAAAFPAKKLSIMGGEFGAWSGDGKKVHWSLGPAHFIYDLEKGKAFDDSLKVAKEAAKEAAKKESKKDSSETKEEKKSKDKKKKDPRFEAEEIRIDLKYKKDIPQGYTLLKNARIITMNGENEVIENGSILIKNNRIEKIGTDISQIPEGTTVIDCKGKTLVPGYVDTHAHMWPNWGIHKNQVWVYAANLAYGVTTTRDPQTATTDVLTYGDMVEAGMIDGPRIYSTGPGVGFWSYKIKSLDHARDVLKQYSEYYDTKTIKMYLTGNRQQRQWIIMACKELGLKPTTEGGLDYKLNMTQIMDGYPGHEHALPITPIQEDVVQFIAQSKTTVTPTMLVAYGGPFAENYFYATEEVYHDEKLYYFTPYEELASKSRRVGAGWFMEEEHVFPRHAEFIKNLVEAGGMAGVGSHGQLQGLGYHWELWAMASGGISPMNMLRVATIIGAESLGLDGDLGSLEKGKLADLIILNANPLEDIRNTNSIEMVVKNGRVYDGNTLDKIAPDAEKAVEFLWQIERPEMTLENAR
ncbi:MAG: amidohydrolase family protein [Bacteroidetes bacterium]|nr:amidohydrolase family protein [Bacteroidota bacterium]